MKNEGTDFAERSGKRSLRGCQLDFSWLHFRQGERRSHAKEKQVYQSHVRIPLSVTSGRNSAMDKPEVENIQRHQVTELPVIKPISMEG